MPEEKKMKKERSRVEKFIRSTAWLFVLFCGAKVAYIVLLKD
jgi:hypothetical protein